MKRILVFLFLAVALPLWAATQDIRLNTSWTDNSDNELGFKVELKIGSGTYQPVGTTQPNVTSFSTDVLGDAGGVTYCYRTYAYNSAGDSVPAPEKCDVSPPISVVTVPNSPSGQTIVIQVLKVDPNAAPKAPTIRKATPPAKTKAK